MTYIVTNIAPFFLQWSVLFLIPFTLIPLLLRIEILQSILYKSKFKPKELFYYLKPFQLKYKNKTLPLISSQILTWNRNEPSRIKCQTENYELQEPPSLHDPSRPFHSIILLFQSNTPYNSSYPSQPPFIATRKKNF